MCPDENVNDSLLQSIPTAIAVYAMPDSHHRDPSEIRHHRWNAAYAALVSLPTEAIAARSAAEALAQGWPAQLLAGFRRAKDSLQKSVAVDLTDSDGQVNYVARCALEDDHLLVVSFEADIHVSDLTP